MVSHFGLVGRDTSDRLGAASADHLRFGMAVDRRCEGITVAIIDAADPAHDPGVGQALRIADRYMLDASIAFK
ncbi:MAG: hypothetical protein B7Z58_15520 [Acidiphilium sp. 37-64-53]|nr:MAG: hypothetical protein B7Z58_15520 [Acidiphilium sp. 37-64-53]